MERMILLLPLVLMWMSQAMMSMSESTRICKRTYVKVGCYETVHTLNLTITDSDPRSPLFSGRMFSWDTYGKDLHSLVCRCHERALEEGSNYFAIEMFAECWTGNISANQFGPKSDDCINQTFKSCNDSHGGECAGDARGQYIYKVASSTTCQKTYDHVGCYEAGDALRMAITDRDLSSPLTSGHMIRWGKSYGRDLHSLVCRCNERAMEEGFNYFAIEFWAECWTGNISANQFPPKSNSCANKDFEPCNGVHGGECTGKAHVQYIYKVNRIHP